MPTPGPGEVVLRLEAAGLNRSEWLFSRGEHLFPPPDHAPIGTEGTGIVETVG